MLACMLCKPDIRNVKTEYQAPGFKHRSVLVLWLMETLFLQHRN